MRRMLRGSTIKRCVTQGVPMPLKITVVKREYGVSIVSPSGSIDTNTYLALEKEAEAVIAESPKIVIFNMEEVDYISSAGISVLIKTKKVLKEKKASLVIVNLQPRVRRVFEIINALPPEQIFESMEEMDRYLAGIQQKR